MANDINMMKQAVDLYYDEKYSEALDMFLTLFKRFMTRENNRSSSLCFHIAICYDMLKRPLEAVTFIEQARDIDPLDLSVNKSYRIIYRNIDALLERKISHNADKKAISKVYDLLLQMGNVSSTTQRSMILFYEKTGQIEDCQNLLDNALERNPNDKLLIEVDKRLNRQLKVV